MIARLGALAAFGIGAGYLAIIALYAPLGAPPSGAEARLAYMAGHEFTWQAILWLSVVTDVLFLPVAAALWVALAGRSRELMLAALAGFLLFVFLDLALTWPNYAVMISLGSSWAAADEAARAALVATAQYPVALAESTLLFVYNSLTLSLAALFAGLAMRGSFSPLAAWLGIATGIAGIAAVFGPLLVPGLNTAIILASLLTMLWMFATGWDLLRRKS